MTGETNRVEIGCKERKKRKMIIGNRGNGKEKHLTVICFDYTLVILPFSEVMDTEIKKWRITNTSKKALKGKKRQEGTEFFL